MVYVQERPLCSLEEHFLPFHQRTFDQDACVSYILLQFASVLRVFVLYRLEVQSCGVPVRVQDPLLERYQELELLSEHIIIDQIVHPDAQPRSLVGVGWSDPSARCPPFGALPQSLFRTVKEPVIWHYD